MPCWTCIQLCLGRMILSKLKSLFKMKGLIYLVMHIMTKSAAHTKNINSSSINQLSDIELWCQFQTYYTLYQVALDVNPNAASFRVVWNNWFDFGNVSWNYFTQSMNNSIKNLILSLVVNFKHIIMVSGHIGLDLIFLGWFPMKNEINLK